MSTTELIPRGWYDATAQRGWRVWGRDDGGAVLEVEFAINVAPGQTVTRSHPFYFTQNAAPVSFKALEAMGWTGRDVTELFDGESAGLHNKPVRVLVDHVSKGGKTYDRIESIGVPKHRFGKPLVSPADRAPYVTRMNAMLASFRGKNAAPAAPVPPVANDDDAIPF